MPKILIVEDHKINQLVLAGLLKYLGEEDIVFADNGVPAVEEFKKQKFDLIFMDCRMPDMDGYTCAKTIRDIEKAASAEPVLIIGTSANSGKEEIQKCLDAGMNEYISKPIKDSRLKEILETLHDTKIDAEPTVDLTNLKILGDSEIAAQLVQIFTDSIKKQFNELCLAYEKQDNEQCDFLLHSMKGISGNIGAVAITAAIDDLSKLKKSDNQKINPSLKELEKTIQSGLKEMQTYISSSK